MDAARGFRLKVQWGYIPTISSSIPVLYPFTGADLYFEMRLSSFCWYREEKFSRLDVRRSPPEPFTHNTSVSSAVKGSVSINFAEVFPPPVFVIR